MSTPPEALRALDQWVLWKYETRDGKLTKVPYQPDGGHASSTNPKTWNTYDAVRAAVEQKPGEFSGIGFVFSPNDDYFGIDLDDCLDETGAPKPWAVPFLKQFKDTYAEVSPSGTGVKIFAKGKLPGPGKRKEYEGGAIEIYDAGRYFAVTARALNGSPLVLEDHQRDIETFYRLASPAAGNAAGNNGSSTTTAGKIPQGQRHTTLVSLAGTMRKRGMTVAAIKAALWTENCERCEPKYDRAHIAKIAESARQWKVEASANLWQFPFTDVGNAERLALLHGNEIRFCHPWGKWIVWDGGRWAVDPTAEIIRRAIDTIRQMHLTAVDIRDEKIRHAAQDFARATEKHARIMAMMSLASALSGIPVLPEELDADPWLLNVRNGTIDLHSGGLREHQQQDLITKICPVDFDPAAECPTWLRFQHQIMARNEDLIRFKQNAIGYALTGLAVEKRSLFIWVGVGNNGKTTEVELIRDMLGDYAGQVRIESLMEQRTRNGAAPSPDIADLRGLRFVVSSEPSEGQKLAESTVKYLLGMGTVKARHLHKDNFEFKQTWKFFMDCNHKPVIRGTDSAIWNRIGLVPFDVVIPEELIDRSMPAKLRRELPGILAWAVRGCLDWQDQDGLVAPVEIRAATADYRNEMDIIGRFIEDCCVVLPNASARANQLYSRWSNWSTSTGENHSLTSTALGIKLRERGIQKTIDNKGARYDGIGLKAAAE